MSGFAASASRIGAPDLGLMSYGEVENQVANICSAVPDLPLIADGDTGYGNAMNVRRTVRGLARAGAAAVMIEDQVAPKRCGHTPGKAVVAREEALDRVRAAVDEAEAIRERGGDVLILARTDARHTLGLDEALWRAEAFAMLGADILFVEAPRSVEEMARICAIGDRPHMANIVEGGATPDLPRAELQSIGYSIAAYPLTLMAAAMQAMTTTLKAMRDDAPREGRMDFAELRCRVGFDAYYEESSRYETARRDDA